MEPPQLGNTKKIQALKKAKSPQVTNFYDLVPKKFQMENRTYDNFSETHIKIPARIILTGTSGSGKTNALLRIVDQVNCFDRIYLYARNLEEPLYKYYTDALEQTEKTTGVSILVKSNDISTLPRVDDLDPKLNHLLIIDDMITEKSKYLARVSEYYTMGRKKYCSCIFLSQSYFRVPLLIRQNTDYFIFTKINTDRDLIFILKDFQLGVNDEEILRLYHEATQNGFPNFLMIDIENTDPTYRFRHDFIPMQVALEDSSPVRLIKKTREDKKRKVQFNDEDVDQELLQETDNERVHRMSGGDIPIKVKSSSKKNKKIDWVKIQSNPIAAKPLPPTKLPTLQERMKSLSIVLEKPVSELKQMGKQLGLTNAQLCDHLEQAIISGEFDDLLMQQGMDYSQNKSSHANELYDD